MMTLRVPRPLLAVGIPALMIAVIALFVRSSLFLTDSPALMLAVSLDLLLTIPVVYFLLIRKTGIPKVTVVPVLMLSTVAASFILPATHQVYIDLFKTWGIPFVEIAVLTFITLKVRSLVRSYRDSKEQAPDFFTALKEACLEIMPPKVVPLFASEVSVIYYGFLSWRRRPLRLNEFSYHKRSGTQALLGAAVVVIAIETVALHLLLAQVSELGAWILTGLSVYTALQVFGVAKSLARRPIVCKEDRLIVRYGILNESEIAFEDIESVELSKQSVTLDKSIARLSPLGDMERHNLIIRLKKENTLTGLYGVKKKFRALALHVDDDLGFKTQMDAVLLDRK